MKKIILMLALGSLFVACRLNPSVTRFDYYFPNNGYAKFTIESAADTIIVQKIDAPVGFIDITDVIPETSSEKFRFVMEELVNPVSSKFCEVTLSSNQVKVIVNENKAPYDILIAIDLNGMPISDRAMQTVGTIVITQKAKP